MQLVDTHCHIHSVDYPLPVPEVEARAAEAGVGAMLVVGCDAADSERAVAFAAGRANTWAVIGQHPHEAKFGDAPLQQLRALLEVEDAPELGGEWPAAGQHPLLPAAGIPARTKEGADGGTRLATPVETVHPFHGSVLGPVTQQPQHLSSGSNPAGKVGAPAPVPPSTEGRGSSTEDRSARPRPSPGKIVAIGECGLDYFYGHSSKADQQKALRYQIELALEHNLPLVFHVRDAFDDFWPIFDSYNGIRGELHSFTDNAKNLSKALERGLYIGVNGIMTFTKNDWQLEVARQIPMEKMLLETDAPFLTPKPLRGKVNEPAHVLLVARFIGSLRQMSLSDVAQYTTTNARQLFSL